MKTFKQFNEVIKGWKNVHSDLAKIRRSQSDASKEVKLVALKKDGKESKMHDAIKSFSSEEEARAHHDNVKKLNPTRGIRHNLYVGGEHKGVLE